MQRSNLSLSHSIPSYLYFVITYKMNGNRILTFTFCIWLVFNNVFARQLTGNTIKTEKLRGLGALHPSSDEFLKNFTLSNRKIFSSDLDMIHKHPDLESIAFLRTSGIIILSRSFFENMTELKELVVHQNNRVIIEEGSFENLKNLQMLSADNQTMTAITRYSFKNCKNLQYLSFNNGFIGEIQSKAFEHLKNLVTVNFNKMSLKHLKPMTFNDLPFLDTIDLSGNKLSQISGKEFYNLPKLRTLNFNKNYLHTINAKEVLHNLPHLITLEISENKFSCIEKLELSSIISSYNITSFNQRDLNRCRYSTEKVQIFSSKR